MHGQDGPPDGCYDHEDLAQQQHELGKLPRASERACPCEIRRTCSVYLAGRQPGPGVCKVSVFCRHTGPHLTRHRGLRGCAYCRRGPEAKEIPLFWSFSVWYSAAHELSWHVVSLWDVFGVQCFVCAQMCSELPNLMVYYLMVLPRLQESTS